MGTGTPFRPPAAERGAGFHPGAHASRRGAGAGGCVCVSPWPPRGLVPWAVGNAGEAPELLQPSVLVVAEEKKPRNSNSSCSRMDASRAVIREGGAAWPRYLLF